MKKCYYKPNRSTPRLFSPCDVSRVARKCAETAENADNEVIRCIAKGLSYSGIAVAKVSDQPDDKATEAIRDALLLVGKVKKAAEAISSLLDKIIEPMEDFVSQFDAVEEFIEENKSILGKLLDKLFGKFGSKKRKIKAAVEIVRKIKEKIEEFNDNIQEVVSTIDKASDLVAKFNSLRGADVYFLEAPINNCKCNGDK